MFAQKLDFIMSLTNSHNIELARSIGVDASLISRLRSGKRRLPKSHDFLPNMCGYLASQMTDEYKKRTAADAVCPGEPWPEDEESACALILRWLQKGNEAQLGSASQLLDRISTLSFPVCPESAARPIAENFPSQLLYYGLEGVKQAVLDFFDLAISDGSKRRIFIFSDENTHWMSNDPQFTQCWSMRLKQLIAMGCEAKLILNTARPSDDLLNSMSQCLPLYITGAVEPYYYPKIRDGVYHRTLFVVEGLCALHSSSVDGLSSGALIHLLTEPDGVAALTNEFFSYFRLCKPLVKTIFDSELLYKQLFECKSTHGTYFLSSISPSLLTMPPKVAERIGYRCGDERFLALCKSRWNSRNLQNSSHQLFELICVPTDRQIYEDAIPVGVSMPLGIRNCFYTAQEYAAHLKNVCAYAREHRNYHFALTQSLPKNTLVCCKEDDWVTISKCSQPCVSIYCEQPAAVGALGLFMRQLYEDTQSTYSLKNSLAELMLKLK